MTANPTNSHATVLSPGDKLDRYEIVEQIGAGGSSIVWKARDPVLGRLVAIKQLVLEDENDAQSVRDRFRTEAAIQKRVSDSSKHLAQVLDFVDEARGLFIVMEYVDGASVEQLLASSSKPIAIPEALAIIGGTALALKSLHDQKVIHRDLKPANILLPKAGGIRISDFGVAALLADQEAMSVGSVRYMAPELFGGDKADARADIYSLGLIAYELLAGREKFEQAFRVVLRDTRNQQLRWMKWHTNTRVKAPPLSELNPQVPERLAELVGRMMEKDPSLRVASADELLEALRRNFDARGRVIDRDRMDSARAAGGETAAMKTAPLPKRSKLPIILAVVLGAQVLIFGGIYFMQQRSVQQQTQQVRRDAERAYLRAKDLFTDGEYLAAIEVFDDLATAWPDDPILGAGSRARIAFARGRLAMTDGEYPRAIEQLEAATAASADLISEVQPYLDQARRRVDFDRTVRDIQMQIESGQLAAARERIHAFNTEARYPDEREQLLSLDDQIDTLRRDERVTDLLTRAEAQLTEGKRDEAIGLLERGNERMPDPRITERLNELYRQRRYDAALATAAAAAERGDLPGEIEALQEAHRIAPGDPLHQRIRERQSAEALQRGLAALEGGDVDGADAAFREAIQYAPNERAQRELSQIATENERARLINAGDIAYAGEKYDIAIERYTEALRLGADLELQNKLREAQLRMQVLTGQAAIAQGDLEAAQEALTAAARINPDNDMVRRLATDLQAHVDYVRYREAGDAMRKDERFGQAKQQYRAAQDLLDTEEIRARLAETEYVSLLSQARSKINRREWPAAKSLLNSAQRVKDTEEVRELLAQVHANE